MLTDFPDTIYNPELFIKSLPAQYDGFFDWSFLREKFPRGIMPADIDGLIEYNGNFLIFETKARFAMIPDGQRRTQQALLKTGYFTIVNIWGDNAEEFMIYTPNGYEYSGNGKDKLIQFVSKWKKATEEKKLRVSQ